MADIEHEFLRHVRREADALLKMINKQLEQKANRTFTCEEDAELFKLMERHMDFTKTIEGMARTLAQKAGRPDTTPDTRVPEIVHTDDHVALPQRSSASIRTNPDSASSGSYRAKNEAHSNRRAFVIPSLGLTSSFGRTPTEPGTTARGRSPHSSSNSTIDFAKGARYHPYAHATRPNPPKSKYAAYVSSDVDDEEQFEPISMRPDPKQTQTMPPTSSQSDSTTWKVKQDLPYPWKKSCRKYWYYYPTTHLSYNAQTATYYRIPTCPHCGREKLPRDGIVKPFKGVDGIIMHFNCAHPELDHNLYLTTKFLKRYEVTADQVQAIIKLL